jgi:periplasmic protein TonB
MLAIKKTDPQKSKQVFLVLVLLGVLVVGGIVSFFLNAGTEEEKVEEEFQFFELTPPPPPPPPPPVDEPEIEPEELDEPLEPLEIPEDAEALSDDQPVNDLGIDIGELASAEGVGGFNVIPSFARRGGLSSDDEDDSLGSGMGGEEPVATFKAQPIYPSALLKKRIGGKVVVTAVVSTAGTVVKATIKQSSGRSELDQAACNAVMKWKFKPGIRNGKPTQSTCLIPYTFEVKNQ